MNYVIVVAMQLTRERKVENKNRQERNSCLLEEKSDKLITCTDIIHQVMALIWGFRPAAHLITIQLKASTVRGIFAN